MIINILHRPGPGAQVEMFRLEQQIAHELGLKTTVMMPVWALSRPDIVEEVRRDRDTYGDEVAMYFGDMDCSGMEGVGESQEPFLWLHTKAAKKAIIDKALSDFRAAFGTDPVSTGSFHVDAWSMEYMKQQCPSLQITVGGCFEEGVKVFHGCNNSWYLFNEGMPWNPWYPARENTLRPAAGEQDWAGMIAVPHLARDMVLSYEGRNDFFASHTGNVQRAMANEGRTMPYALNMADMYRYQERFNDGFSYMNIFVSPGWLRGNPYVQDDDETSQNLYRDYLGYFAQLKAEGKVQDMTMGEFAGWFRANVPIGKPHIYDAKEILYGSGKEYLWYSSPDMRVTFDLCQGGSIGDLRPLVARQPRCTGADMPDGFMASNPHLIHSQYRSGNSHHYLDGARTTLLVTHNGETLDLCDFPVRMESIERRGNTVCFALTPAHLTFADGVEATITTRYEIEEGGRIGICRCVHCSDPDAVFTLCEYIKGGYGTTEYPEPMQSLTLAVEGDENRQLQYSYEGRTLSASGAKKAGVVIPPLNTACWLTAQQGFTRAAAVEGVLFNPYYTLKLEGECCDGKETKACLVLTKS